MSLFSPPSLKCSFLKTKLGEILKIYFTIRFTVPPMLDVSFSDLSIIRSSSGVRNIQIPIKYFAKSTVSFKLSKMSTDSQPAVPEVPIMVQQSQTHRDPVHVLVQGKSQYYNGGNSKNVIIAPPLDRR